MKKIQDQLQTIAKALNSISQQLEQITGQVDQLNSTKAAVPEVAPVKKAVAKKTGRKPAARAKVAAAAKKDEGKGSTVLDTVFEVIKKSRKGVSIAKLRDKTGLEARQLSNALYKLSKRGKIEAVSRGLYVKK